MGAIQVNNLGKAYKQYPSRWSRLIEWVFPFTSPRHQLNWVLQDINFQVQAGESIGILGVNGAGKSTLLKIITGTTQPTKGDIEVGGHVAALLELGMGFHPDFTGRQNVYMAGQLLGYSVAEISGFMSEIEFFAEIGDYIDQPVRVYSSGMQVRLAFAVATAKKPDLLIVDEALAVGDAAFQRKCYRRIEEFCKQGTTLLFVTHDIETVKRICQKALVLKNGQVAAFGPAKTICDEYEKQLFSHPKSLPEKAATSEISEYSRPNVSQASGASTEYGDGRAVIQRVWLENEHGQAINVIPSGESFNLKYLVSFKEELDNLIFAMMIKTREGISVYGTDTTCFSQEKLRYPAGRCIQVSFRIENHLAPGTFYINCGIRQETPEHAVFIHRRVDTAIFKVTPSDSTTVHSGLIEMRAQIQMVEVANA